MAPNTALSLDADLAVGTETEIVSVTATAAVLQTDSAAVQAEPFYVNGTRQQDTLITIDGAPANRTRANGHIIGVPNVVSAPE